VRRHASGFWQHVVLVYKGTRSSKTDQSCRLLVEELPLAGLHKMGIVHTRSYRGYRRLDAHVCSKDVLTGGRAEAPCGHTARKKIQMLSRAGLQA
jgi:hypothetical protein